jgi:septal ring factor EnvC (AmiA/AmiB activator)
MKLPVRAGVIGTVSVLAGTLLTVPSFAVEPCDSGAEVRAQVKELVAELRDDVRSRKARSATAQALVETLRTSRGATADTAAERRALGQEIAALAQRLEESSNRVERKPLVVAEILALTEQRERGRFTDAE